MIVIGSDHGGFDLKTAIVRFLKDERNIEILDVGTNDGDSVDYPQFALKVANMVASDAAERGILVCGTGIGMSITANKVPGIRAALATDVFMGRMAKEHNNANILVLGARVLDEKRACDIVSAWLDASFSGGRHEARLNQIAGIEKKYCK